MAKSLAAESTRLARFDWPSVATSHIGDQPDLETMDGMRAAIEMLWKAVHGGAAGARMFTEELQQLLENRDVPIVLEAPITSTMLAPDAPGAAANDDYTDILAALRGLMHTSYFDPTAGTSGEAVGGVAGLFKGVTFLQCNANDPHIFNNAADPRWAIVAAGCPHSGLKFSNYFGVPRYAKATADWTDAGNDNTYESYVDANVVTDKGGGTVVLRPDGATMTVRVYLPRSTTMTPNIRSGEVFTFLWDDAGRALCNDLLCIDEPIGSTRDLAVADAGTITAYNSGRRGWFTMNGSNSTKNAGGRVFAGYISGDPTYGTVGGSVAAAVAGTISAHAASGSDPTVTIAAQGGGPASVTVVSNTTGVAAGSTFVFDEETIGGTTLTDPSLIQSLSDPGHSHTATITHAAIAAAVSGSITDDAVAAALANHTFTGTSVTPAAITVLKIQRMS